MKVEAASLRDGLAVVARDYPGAWLGHADDVASDGARRVYWSDPEVPGLSDGHDAREVATILVIEVAS